MNNYVANPNYSDAAGSPYWTVVVPGAQTLSPDEAVADITQLAVGTVMDNGYYRAAQVQDVSKLGVAGTSLSVTTGGQYGNTNPSPFFDRGDSFAYVNSVAGISTGLRIAILEGLQTDASPYTAGSMSTDAFTSEWMTARAVGQIPAVANNQNYQSFQSGSLTSSYCAYLMTNGNAFGAAGFLTPISSFSTRFSGATSYWLTPASAAATSPYFFISASSDPQAMANFISEFASDFTATGTAINSILVGSSRSIVNCVVDPSVNGFTTGQYLSFVDIGTNTILSPASYQNQSTTGWYVGQVTGMNSFTILATTTTGGSSATVTFNPTTEDHTGVLPGMIVAGTGIPSGATVVSVGASSFTISAGATIATTGVTLTISKGATNSYFLVCDRSTNYGQPIPGTWNQLILTTSAISSTTLTISAIATSSGSTAGYGYGTVLAGGSTYASGVSTGLFSNSGPFSIAVGSTIPIATHYGSTSAGTTATLGYVSAPSNVVSFIASGTSGTNTITITSSLYILGNGMLAVGQSISGTGIPSNSYITAISGNTLTISANLTANLNGTTSIATTSCSGMIYGTSFPAGNTIVLNNNDNTYVFDFGVPYFAPYLTNTGGGSIPPGETPTAGVGGSHYGCDFYLPVTLTNIIGTPLANFQSAAVTGSSSAIYVDTTTNFYVGQKITFGSFGNLTITSVPSSTEIIVSGTAAGAATYNTVNYSNGSSPNDIWNYDDYLLSGAVFDTVTGTTSGTGAIGFDGTFITGFHQTGTYVLAYQDGPRYIGSSSVGDLEQIVPTTIGSTVGGTLYQPVAAGSTTFAVNPNPNTVPGTTTFGINQYQNYTYGGFVPLINNGVTNNFVGNITTGSTVITGVASQYSFGLSVGQTVDIASTAHFPSGTEIVTVGKGTVTVSNAATTSASATSLTATSNAIYTLVVGQGSTQEMVAVISPSNSTSLGSTGSNPIGLPFTPGETLDGSGNINSPMLWTLADGQTFQFDHDAGDIVVTPNVVYSVGGSTISHAQQTPFLGDPNVGTVYSISGGTDYAQTNALIATNPTSELIINAAANFNLTNPWLDSGVGGFPNISTSLAATASAGDTTITVADNAGFPQTVQTVFQNGITIQPSTVGTLVGSLAANATSLTIIPKAEVPQTTPFFINISGLSGTETLEIGSVYYNSALNLATLQLSNFQVQGMVATGSTSVWLGAAAITNVAPGQVITDTLGYIPAGTTVVSVSTTSITISNPATNGATENLQFYTSSTTLSYADLTPVLLDSFPTDTQYHTLEVPSFYLTTALNLGATVTSLSTTPLPVTVPSGTTLYINNGIFYDSFVTSATANAGATGVSINSYTPHFPFPASSGSSGVFTTYGSIVSVGLASPLQPNQTIFLNCPGAIGSLGNPSFGITVKEYTPQNAFTIPVLPFISPYAFDTTTTEVDFTGSVTNGSNAITSVSSTAGLSVGQQVFTSQDGLSTTQPAFIAEISGSTVYLTTPSVTAATGATSQYFNVYPTQFLSPSPVTLDADPLQEVVYPISVPVPNAINPNAWDVNLALSLAYDHDFGAEVFYYAYPTNFHVNDVTYRPDLGIFQTWDGSQWRTTRVNAVQVLLSILGSFGGKDTTNVTLIDPNTGANTPPDVFANTLSTAFTAYFGGNRSKDPNGDEWTGDALNNILLNISVQVPQNQTVAYRSLGLIAQYKSEPLAESIYISPSDNCVINEDAVTSVNWTYSDLDNDQQTGWSVKIFSQASVYLPNFSPDTTTPVWQKSAYNASTSVTFDTDSGFVNGQKYYAYVKVSKTFHQKDWWGAWNSCPFTVIINAPQAPMVAVYADDDNAVNTITIQSTDNLLGPDNGSFTNSLGGWTRGQNDTVGTSLEVASTGIALRTPLTAGTVYTSLNVGAIGYIASGSTIASSGKGTFKVSSTYPKNTDALGFPVSGEFWVTIGGENILVTNKVDGNNSGDTFVIQQRNYTVAGVPSTQSAHAAGATVTFGLQEPIFVDSELQLHFTEVIEQKWVDKQKILVRTIPGTPGWSSTNTTGFQIISNGQGNQVHVVDPGNVLSNGWAGRTVYINHKESMGWTTAQASQTVKRVLGSLIGNAINYNVSKLEPAVIQSVKAVSTIPSRTTTLAVVSTDTQFPKGNGLYIPVTPKGGYPLLSLPAGTVLNISNGQIIGVNVFQGGKIDWTHYNAINTVTLTAPYRIGDSGMHVAGITNGFGSNVKAKDITLGFLPRGAVITYVAPSLYTEKVVTFTKPYGKQAPYTGIGVSIGDTLDLSVTTYYAGTSAVNVYGYKYTNKVGGPGHTKLVPLEQKVISDFTVPSFSATGTVGTLVGTTFTPLTTGASVANLTATWSIYGNTITAASTAGLAVGQLVSGYGIQSNSYITNISGSSVTLSNPTNVATGSSIGLLAYPTFNAIQLSTNPFGSTSPVGDAVTGAGISPATVVNAVGSTYSVVGLSATGVVQFQSVSATAPYNPIKPVVQIPVTFNGAANFKIPAGSTVIKTKPFVAHSSFPFGTAVKINYPALYSDHTFTIVPNGGSGTGTDIAEIGLLHTSGSNYTGKFTPTNSIPIIAGLTYGIVGFTRLMTTPRTSGGIPTMSVFVDIYDASGNWIGTENSSNPAYQAVLSSSTGQWGSGWVPVAYSFVAPTNAAYAVPRFQWKNVSSVDAYGLSGLMFKAINLPAFDLNHNIVNITSQIGTSSQLMRLETSLYPQGTSSNDNTQVANAISLPQSSSESYASLGGYDSLYVFDPYNTSGVYEIQQGGSDNELFTTLTAAVTVGVPVGGITYLPLASTKGIAVGTTLYVDYGNANTYENVIVDPSWDGSTNVAVQTNTGNGYSTANGFARNHSLGARVYVVTIGLAGTVNYTHVAGATASQGVAIFNWNSDGFVNQPNDTYEYLVQKSVDGGATWTPIRNGNNVKATGTGWATITDYEAVPGQATLYQAIPKFVSKAGTVTKRGPKSAPIAPENTMTTSTWWIADSSNPTNRFPILVQNQYTDKTKHPSGIFYPLGSARPFTISGVTQGRDADIKVIWEDLDNWPNFLKLLNSGNILILTNPVESSRTYIFISDDVQTTYNAATSPWFEVEINYVEAAPPGYGFTYGSNLS